MPETALEYISPRLRPLAHPIESLTLDPRNARRHTDKDLDETRKSLLAHGMRGVVIVQKKGSELIVRAGNGRVMIARQLGWTHLPCDIYEEDDAEAVAFAIRHNKTGENAEWDTDVLASLKEEFSLSLDELGFDQIDLSLPPPDPETEPEEKDKKTNAPPSDEEHLPTERPPPRAKVGDVLELGRHTLHCDDCIAVMDGMDPDSIDAVVTDPPYGLSPDGKARTWDELEVLRAEGKGPKGGFMGKEWDAGVPGITWARALLRVMKPGAHAVIFSANRTIHRLTCALEDAGFEVRDQIGWVTWSGFPKGSCVQKGLIRSVRCLLKDGAQLAVQCSAPIRARSSAGKEPIAAALVQILPEGGVGLLTATGREVALSALTATSLSELTEATGLSIASSWSDCLDDHWHQMSRFITETKTEEITDQRISNLLTSHHTSANTTPCSATLPSGALWPATTVASSSSGSLGSSSAIPIVTAIGSATWNPVVKWRGFDVSLKPAMEPAILVRKPISESTIAQNVIKHGTGALNIDACRIGYGDPAWPGPGDRWADGKPGEAPTPDGVTWGGALNARVSRSDPGGRWPANIYATPKASSSEREEGCESLAPTDREGVTGRKPDSAGGNHARAGITAKGDIRNYHPTVKPRRLIEWLVTLVTPPEGVVFDPFAGSGTIFVAATGADRKAIGVELDPGHCDICEARAVSAQKESNK